jgi:sec-independent protein translocase protein TatA
MGAMSMWHWLILLGVAVLLFGGGGKISSIMGDVAKGVKSFKKGMADDDAPVTGNGKAIGHDGTPAAATDTHSEKA